MARIPEPRPGLVFRYRYLRVWQYLRGEQVGKERPCCILLSLKPGQAIAGIAIHDEVSGTTQQRYIAGDNEVLIVLVQSDPPGADQAGLPLSLEDKRYIGLPADAPSYVIVSEANIDRWPNADMCLVPGRPTSFTYDRPLSGPTLSRVMRAFLRVHATGKTRLLIRQP